MSVSPDLITSGLVNNFDSRIADASLILPEFEIWFLPMLIILLTKISCSFLESIVSISNGTKTMIESHRIKTKGIHHSSVS